MQNRRFLPHLLGARTWHGTLAGTPALPPETAADPAHRSRCFLSCQRIIGMGHQGHVVAASKRFDERWTKGRHKRQQAFNKCSGETQHGSLCSGEITMLLLFLSPSS